MDRELSNLLAAHAWCDRATGGAMLGLELANNVRTYWIDRGLFALGEQVFLEALAREGAQDRSTQHGHALFAFGQHQNFCGRFADGIALLEEGLAIARELGDDLYAAHCLDKIAYARAYLGDAVAALARVEEELVIRRRLGPADQVTRALITKGAILRMNGDFDAAVAVFQQALALSKGDDLEEVHVIHSELARVCTARGSLSDARISLIEAINLLLQTNSRFRSMVALDVAALLAAARGDWQRAARLQCVFDTTLDQFGGFQNPYDDRILAELRQKPRAKLGPGPYAAAYEVGRHLRLEAALSETLAWLQEDPDT
jgi:non-specific serine/threonine protein kinase